jgi:nitrogen regulatory protein A
VIILGQLEKINEICKDISANLPCDFVSVGILHDTNKTISWMAVFGNRNDKYKRIKMRYGKGIAGNVIRTGKYFMFDSFPDVIYGKAVDYPLLIAEQLVSGVAVPIVNTNGICGVLLSADRFNHIFHQEQIDLLQDYTKKIGNFISEISV